MHDVLDSVCESLDELSSVILQSSSEDRTLAEVHGWQHPALTRQNISAIPSALAEKIRQTDANDVPSELLAELEDVPRRLGLLHPTTVPHIFNGNAMTALPALTSTINWLAGILDPIFGWQTLTDNKAMPAPLARRLRGIQADIDELVPNKERLGEQIRQIQDATDAAESLPTDMQSLKEARKTIDRLSTESAELYGKIDERHKNVIDAAKNIADRQQEANKLVEQCEEAYRITTTKGLAAAFDQRATQLGQSMWLWVAGLLCALAMGSYLGSHRVELLSSAIANKDPQWGIIWMHIALSALSVGAPLWFAWLATKQIGQRFKLAEDYGFKASVAKAYEGYKREAARIDEAFEARLFSSALTRLEEAPLRLIGNAEYGSPWHELISSDAFQKAISQIPELKDKFVEIAKNGMSKIGNLNIKK
jgi:gas vesicle protein